MLQSWTTSAPCDVLDNMLTSAAGVKTRRACARATVESSNLKLQRTTSRTTWWIRRPAGYLSTNAIAFTSSSQTARELKNARQTLGRSPGDESERENATQASQRPGAVSADKGASSPVRAGLGEAAKENSPGVGVDAVYRVIMVAWRLPSGSELACAAGCWA